MQTSSYRAVDAGRCFILRLALAVIASFAIPLATAQPKAKTADDQWNDLVQPRPATSKGTPSGLSTGQVAAGEAQKATDARQLAQTAKSFYVENPTHVHAAEAKKLEAAESILGITDSDPAYEVAARKVADAFRRDATNPVADRFDVAVLAELTDARGKLGGTRFGRNAAEQEKIGDRLRAEFGNIPPVFNYYVAVARGAEMASAFALANKVLQAPANPEAIAEARSIVARQGLLNKPLPVQLRQLGGQKIDLAQPSGKLTLLFCLSPAQGCGALAAAKKALGDARIIYYFPVGSLAEVTAAAAKAPLAGTVCADLNAEGNAALQQLGLRQLPYVFVLNRAGRLAAFGPTDALTAMITAANN